MAADPRWRLSGGATNEDPDASLGGVMSATETGLGVDNDLYDDASGAETDAGHTDYRGVYVFNNGDVELADAVVWIVSEVGAGADIELAIADEGVGATMETIADEETAPTGPAFQEAPDKANGIVVGSIPAGSRCGIWIKRIIAAETSAKDAATFTLRVEGDTAE